QQHCAAHGRRELMRTRDCGVTVVEQLRLRGREAADHHPAARHRDDELRRYSVGLPRRLVGDALELPRGPPAREMLGDADRFELTLELLEDFVGQWVGHARRDASRMPK